MSKILVVDDEPDVRNLCRIVLTNEGYAVVEAEDGAGCLAAAPREQPDLVLLDVMMPEMDGVDTLRALKHDPRTRRIPVIMVTALDGLPQITLATYAGADGYITKPFEVQDLLTFVRRFVEPEPVSAST